MNIIKGGVMTSKRKRFIRDMVELEKIIADTRKTIKEGGYDKRSLRIS